jgi:heme/copper-type cytochrome/quinol oxidase subunit 1
VNPLVRRYLKSAVLFLVTGLALGVWMLVSREFGAWQPLRLRSAHTHALLVGFVMMMISGVALWMFPRVPADDTRYRPAIAEAAWWCLAPGTALRVALEVTLPAEASVTTRALLVTAGLAQVVGLVLFFWTMWPRIRASGAASGGR